MAEQLKDLRKRIKSVASTRQITRTMELVATSKMKRAQEAVNAAKPYNEKLRELLGEVAAAAGATDEPLLAMRDSPRKALITMICGNRGLCGGYNANVIRHTKRFLADMKDQGREAVLDVVGKKGVSTLSYQGYAIGRRYLDVGDRPGFADAQRLVASMRDAFLAREVDEVYVIWTHWISAGTQRATTLRLLPIERPQGASAGGDMIFKPSPELLLGKLLPMYLTQTVYTCLVEATASELVARRTAMKSATDNATEMIDTLTRRLNRARQAQITQEIAEVVSGADALRD